MRHPPGSIKRSERDLCARAVHPASPRRGGLAIWPSGRVLPSKQATTATSRGKPCTSMNEHDGPRAVRRWEGWEFQDLVIPVSLFVRHWRHPDAVGTAAPRVQPIILAALEEAAREGWRGRAHRFRHVVQPITGPHHGFLPAVADLFRVNSPVAPHQLGIIGSTRLGQYQDDPAPGLMQPGQRRPWPRVRQ